mgnify:CR=1 FL=1
MLPAACINYPLISPQSKGVNTYNENRGLWETEYILIYFKHVFYRKSLRQDNEHVRPGCSEFLHITTKSQLWSEHWSLETRGALLTSANAGSNQITAHTSPGDPAHHEECGMVRRLLGELASVVIKSRMWWMEWHSRPEIVTHSWAEN